MKSKLIAVGALVTALGLTGGLASAQSTSAILVTIPFSFYVGERELPAGRYEVRPEGTVFAQLTLRSIDNGTKMLLPVTTRLADMGTAKPRVVFDKAGERHYLSEVHVPDSDGYALQGASGEHRHESLLGTT